MTKTLRREYKREVGAVYEKIQQSQERLKRFSQSARDKSNSEDNRARSARRRDEEKRELNDHTAYMKELMQLTARKGAMARSFQERAFRQRKKSGREANMEADDDKILYSRWDPQLDGATRQSISSAPIFKTPRQERKQKALERNKEIEKALRWERENSYIMTTASGSRFRVFQYGTLPQVKR